jgi:hypothetical protein
MTSDVTHQPASSHASVSWTIIRVAAARSRWRLIIVMNTHRHPRLWIPLLLTAAFPAAAIAAPEAPPASPEVAVAMQPYFDSHKLAGVIRSR